MLRADSLRVQEVAAVMAEYGDVHVVKQAPTLFWVHFDEFTAAHTIDSVLKETAVQAMGTVRKSSCAVRFQHSNSL